MIEAHPVSVYKIVPMAAWHAATGAGHVPPMPIDVTDGYIHLSTAAQLRETLRLHFAGQSDLAVLAVDAGAFAEKLRWEPSRGGQLFPHLYGVLEVGFVTAAYPVSCATGSVVGLPEDLR